MVVYSFIGGNRVEHIYLQGDTLGMPTITLKGYQCERCGHKWLPKEDTKNKPKVCPKCKSPYWDTPRRK